MKKIFINGKFLCQKITGVQRFALEIVKEFDKMADDNLELFLICPSEKYVVSNIKFEKIRIIFLKGKPNYWWEQIILSHYCKKNKPDEFLNLCNIAPVLYPGSCVIHDIGVIEAPKGFSFKQRLVYKIINKCNIKRYKKVFTVSNTMNNHISDFYKRHDIITIYNGYQHILSIKSKKPKIDLPNDYFFSLGSANPNKNFKSIIKIAKNNPNMNFIVSGNKSKSFSKEKLEKVSNVIFTGYLSDEEIVYLYKNCVAFLFPSIYEGFGIPPLEALACGCKNVICNDIPVLREIYKKNVQFVHFNEIKSIILENKSNINEIEYNWKVSALLIIKELL